MEIDDTCNWVALGPEKRPDVAAGAHEATKDALAVDDDMPLAVPPPPRTQGERIARLEEEVHGMRLGQSEVLDHMARDFSRTKQGIHTKEQNGEESDSKCVEAKEKSNLKTSLTSMKEKKSKSWLKYLQVWSNYGVIGEVMLKGTHFGA
ncbi:hypothetical protein Tco_1434662 [Tanacetum coccineum]